jgi:hypothetical protein
MSKTKQTILRAIAIKLEVETHKKYRSVMTKIFWLIFIGFLGYGLYNSVISYSHAKSILSDAEYIEASVEELPDFISDTQSSYRYTFFVGGKEYEQEFVASHKNYKNYIGTQGIKIAYKKIDPSQSGIATVVEKNGSIGSIFKHFALMFFVGGFSLMVIYMFITDGIVQPIEEYEDEDEEGQ